MFVSAGRIVQRRAVNGLSLLAPLFLAFEIWQLVMSERYLGIKQIARGSDPREMGPSEPVSFLWASSIALYAAWTLALLASHGTRGPALGLIATTVLGYAVRRNCGLKWILVVLTFEGAIRIVFVGALSVAAWRRL
jgi:hypothetical protein